MPYTAIINFYVFRIQMCMTILQVLQNMHLRRELGQDTDILRFSSLNISTLEICYFLPSQKNVCTFARTIGFGRIILL